MVPTAGNNLAPDHCCCLDSFCSVSFASIFCSADFAWLRSLPSPVPAQAIQQPKNKRALPTWSRNKTSLHTGRPKALTPEPGQGAFSKVLCEPFGDSAGGGLSSSWAHVDSVRLHGSYPRLIGADSEVVLWDLRRAQQALADIQHKLAHREV